MLAIIEQGTRAFKPMIQKLYHSQKNDLEMRFYLYGKFSNHERFIKYNDVNIQISKEIFNNDELDIMPVADPTQSSEAHRYIKLQFLQQLMQTPMINILNLPELAKRIFKDMQIERPEELIAPPPDPKQDPKEMEVQMKHQREMMKIELDQIKEQRESVKLEIEMLKTKIKQQEALMKQQESDEKQRTMIARANKDQQEANVKERMARVAEDKVEVERERLKLMSRQD